MSENLSKWMKEVRHFYRNPGKISNRETALLIIDMEKYFASPSGKAYLPATKDIIPNIKKLLDFFRENNLLIIYTAHQHCRIEEDGGMLAKWWGAYIEGNSKEAEICNELRPKGERILKKRRYSAFYQTELELVLRGRAIKNLIITGVMTNLCCETTARDAFMRDFQVFF